jgi:hypothetical protein
LGQNLSKPLKTAEKFDTIYLKAALMEPFYTIRFKRSVALQFKQFSKRIAKTHTQALEAMLHFFQWHGISLFDQFGPQLQHEEEKIQTKPIFGKPYFKLEISLGELIKIEMFIKRDEGF